MSDKLQETKDADKALSSTEEKLKTLQDFFESNETKKAFNLLRYYTVHFIINRKLDKFLKRNEDIYVQNNTNPRSVFSLEFHEPDNLLMKHRVKISNTNLPINLNSLVSPIMMRESCSLTECLNNGMLTLVSAEYAEKKLKDPKNQEKIKKIWGPYN